MVRNERSPEDLIAEILALRKQLRMAKMIMMKHGLLKAYNKSASFEKMASNKNKRS